MLRITGGTLCGRFIQSPKNRQVRPTTGRLRESFFGQIQQCIPGSKFLDLFAGTGMMGFEAMSRGASLVIAVEDAMQQYRLIQKNRDSLGISPETLVIFQKRVEDFLHSDVPEKPFDIIFLDPPYGYRGLEPIVHCILDQQWIHPESMIAIEHDQSQPELEGFDRKSYGDSILSVYRKRSRPLI